jgi:hypothetical protein
MDMVLVPKSKNGSSTNLNVTILPVEPGQTLKKAKAQLPTAYAKMFQRYSQGAQGDLNIDGTPGFWNTGTYETGTRHARCGCTRPASCAVAKPTPSPRSRSTRITPTTRRYSGYDQFHQVGRLGSAPATSVEAPGLASTWGLCVRRRVQHLVLVLVGRLSAEKAPKMQGEGDGSPEAHECIIMAQHSVYSGLHLGPHGVSKFIALSSWKIDAEDDTGDDDYDGHAKVLQNHGGYRSARDQWCIRDDR